MQEVFQPLYVFHATYNATYNATFILASFPGSCVGGATFILEPLHQLEPRPLIVHVIHAKCPLDRFMYAELVN